MVKLRKGSNRSVVMVSMTNKAVWGIHTKDDHLFLSQKLIAIGWEEMGNLSDISTSRDSYKKST